MKKNIFLTFGILILAFVFSISCSEDNPVVEALVGKMEADINGTKWKADLPAGTSSAIITIINGASLDKTALNLNINGDTTGIYNLDLLSASVQCGLTYTVQAVESLDTTTKIYTGTSGRVEITDKTDSRISGTFSFKASHISLTDTASVNIENGIFKNIYYK